MAADSVAIPREGTAQTAGVLAACTLVVGLGIAVLSMPALQHWFVIPCLISALLLLGDAVAWATGEVDLLSARGVVAVYGLHFFFLAPVLHVAGNYWLPYVV